MESEDTNITISHLKKDENSENEWMVQSNEDHSKGVAVLAESFGSAFASAEWCHDAGVLHDKGKEQQGFQKYIRIKSGYIESNTKACKCPHAYVGALMAHSLGLVPLSPVIAGHHAGLPDDVDLKDVLSRSIPDEVNRKVDLQNPAVPPVRKPADYSHWVRMLFSSLVDADYLDTERFMKPDMANLRHPRVSLKDLLPKLEEYLDNLKSKSIPTPVNQIRGDIQQRCREMSASAPGFYSLTVPTGGGKTLSSLLWAMLHAIRHDKQRIIIAIPYTSIIIQTASILRGIFGEENVLEHHSDVDYPEDDDDVSMSMRLATENWDYPIVVTTNVRLFESMFSARPSACRKLHNICNSVVILDEIQTLPIDFLQPIVDSLKAYSSIFGVSVLFTTASMPAIRKNEAYEQEMRQARGKSFVGIPNVVELIPEEWKLHDKLRRVDIDINDKEDLTAEQVADEMCKHDRVLCIVNTRQHAKEIFDALPKEGLTLHLSKNMHSVHIKQTLRKITDALMDPSQRVVRVVATQLVEAGVDVDFPYVMREQAGLDSIIQAAGRCNREGKLDRGECKVFAMGSLPLGYISQCNSARRYMPDIQDIQSPDAMLSYFYQLYAHQDFDKHGIGLELNNPLEINFRTADGKFRLIDDTNQVNIVVDCPETQDCIERILNGAIDKNTFRIASLYSIGIGEYSRLFNELKDNNQLRELAPGLYSTKYCNYHSDTGLFCNGEVANEAILI